MGGAPEGTSKMLTMKHIHLRVEHGAQLNTLKVVSDPLIRGAACRDDCDDATGKSRALVSD